MRFAIVATLAAMTLASPALAVTRQQPLAPASARQSDRLADPDEATERLADRTERAAHHGTYDRESARSAMEYGSRQSSYGPQGH